MAVRQPTLRRPRRRAIRPALGIVYVRAPLVVAGSAYQLSTGSSYEVTTRD